MMPPLRSFDDLVGKERGQKKTDDLRTMTTLGPRTLREKHVCESINDNFLLLKGFKISFVLSYTIPFFYYTLHTHSLKMVQYAPWVPLTGMYLLPKSLITYQILKCAKRIVST